MPEAYPENVAGDFYVEKGCCTCCDVPRDIVPHLFEYAEEPGEYMHCYVSKQPSNGDELDDMLRVIQCAELQCIHYRGSDPIVLGRIADLGEAAVCDVLVAEPQQVSGEEVPYHRTFSRLLVVLALFSVPFFLLLPEVSQATSDSIRPMVALFGISVASLWCPVLVYAGIRTRCWIDVLFGCAGIGTLLFWALLFLWR